MCLIEHEELEKYRKFRIRTNTFETLWSRDERYLMNLQRSKYIKQLQKLMDYKNESI